LYGGFTELTETVGCETDWPYPMSGFFSGKSVYKTFTDKCEDASSSGRCDDPPSIPCACCKEWDHSPDLAQPGDNLGLGVPDNYFEPTSGELLEAALETAVATILGSAVFAAGGAAATVSHELTEGDLILRAAFDVKSPKVLERYLWTGHLEVFWPFELNGEIKYDFQLPCNSGLLCHQMPGNSCGTPKHCWDAAALLKSRLSATGAQDQRVIYTTKRTYDNQKKEYLVDPDWGFEAFPKRADLAGAAAVKTKWAGLLDVDEADVENLVDWLRGAEKDGNGDFLPYRDRDGWVLGDIVFSTPVVVGVPPLGAISEKDTGDPDEPNSGVSGFWAYRNAKIAEYKTERVYKMIYAGANDGMLHAFVMGVWLPAEQQWAYASKAGGTCPDGLLCDDDVGKELWAFVPSNLLTELKDPAEESYGTTWVGACTHRNLVDLSPTAWQVFIDHDGNTSTPRQWRTVLIGGERGGGDLYFGIDVTDPLNPRLLWEYSVVKDLEHVKTLAWRVDNYESLKLLPFSWAKPYVGRVHVPDPVKFYARVSDTDPTLAAMPTGARHMAFLGSGVRLFDEVLTLKNGVKLGGNDLRDMLKPFFMAIDVGTGRNYFTYVWTSVYAKAMQPNPFEVQLNKGYYLPYAMADPLVLDVWDSSGGQTGDDGYVDSIYVGDLRGYLYGFKFIDFRKGATASTVKFDLWVTKAIDEGVGSGWNWSRTRWAGQPITTQPAASLDRDHENFVRVIFGTGKYDVITGENDDKTDPAKMGLYNLKDHVDMATPTSLVCEETIEYSPSAQIKSSNLTVCFTPNCGDPPYNDRMDTFRMGCNPTDADTIDPKCCRWTIDDDDEGVGDCCTPDPSSCCDKADPNCYQQPCWACVYDFTHPLPGEADAGSPGERMINKVVIAGGLTFATTFTPSLDLCSGVGIGRLYIFHYQCKLLPDDYNPLREPGTLNWSYIHSPNTPQGVIGVQVNLGPGMPSQPILDSSGENVIVQSSTADLLVVPVRLPGEPTDVKGWREVESQ
ncbi:pilus assembly protein, partial [Thermodesulfobacteriota bacterium]